VRAEPALNPAFACPAVRYVEGVGRCDWPDSRLDLAELPLEMPTGRSGTERCRSRSRRGHAERTLVPPGTVRLVGIHEFE
jgi:hypothetical protein